MPLILPSRRYSAGIFGLLLIVWTLSACERDSAEKSQPPDLLASEMLEAPEVFVWDDQPIEFSPPPTRWERQKQTSGGRLGIRFVLYEDGGQSMDVGEFTAVGQLDHCSELEALAAELEQSNARTFARALQRARPHRPGTFSNASLVEGFDAAQRSLDGSRLAYQQGDIESARNGIEAALWNLESVSLPLDDIAPQAFFDPSGYEQIGRIETDPPTESEVAGRPAFRIRYRLWPYDREGVTHGIIDYAAHNNRLFVFQFQGSEDRIPLFEALLETVSFPEGPCEHP